ncbi:MAG TPA: hypothetical protein DCX54_02755 [Flavobacteriales bacterium]|nr:hypothetical protein [Flavobacteriales bacterium]
MKSLTLLISSALFVALINPLFAEGDTKLGGIRAGYHQSDIFNNGSNTGNPNTGFYLGVYKNNKIVPTLHWMVGLEYYQNGSKSDSARKWTMNTIGVPVNLKVKAGPVFALGGISANFVISQDYENSGIAGGAQKAPVFDLPVFLGAGFRVLVVNIEARYYWGMIGIDRHGDKNQFWQLGLGVSF